MQVVKKLRKKLDYIIFKEGKEKTVEYAVKNQIAIVNPLWMHESIENNKLQDHKKYLYVNKSFTESTLNKDILNLVSENKKLESKKRKFVSLEGDNENGATKLYKKNGVGKTDKISINDNLPIVNNNENNKITNFFRSNGKKNEDKDGNENSTTMISTFQVKTIKINVNSTYENIPTKEPEVIKISSINLNEVNKFKIISTVRTLGRYKYMGETMENIKSSDYVITTPVYNKNDIRMIYVMLKGLKLLNFNYFPDSLNDLKFKGIEEYIIATPSLTPMKEDGMKDIHLPLPLEENKYKIHIHPSLYKDDELKQQILEDIIILLGGGKEITKNIRMADICVINKEDANESYPGHVKLLNQDFIFDCFHNFKIMEMNNIKYKPERINVKKFNK